MAHKSDAAEAERRVNEIYQRLILRQNKAQIVRYASENWGKITERQVENYIRKAYELLKQELSGDRQQLLAEHIATRNQLFQKAYAEKRYQTALNVLDSTAKLQGLFITLDQAIEVVTAHDFTVTDSSAIAEDESQG